MTDGSSGSCFMPCVRSRCLKSTPCDRTDRRWSHVEHGARKSRSKGKHIAGALGALGGVDPVHVLTFSCWRPTDTSTCHAAPNRRGPPSEAALGQSAEPRRCTVFGAVLRGLGPRFPAAPVGPASEELIQRGCVLFSRISSNRIRLVSHVYQAGPTASPKIPRVGQTPRPLIWMPT